MPNKHGGFRGVVYPLLAFFMPMLLALAAFAWLGIYPFGEKSLLLIDMNGEYIDYYAQLDRILSQKETLLRTWNMGMGLNMLGLIAFYTASPFLLLLFLFPLSHITEVVFLITLLKLGTAGLTFFLYARYTFGQRGLFGVALSVAYALMSYNVVYSSNLMWLDGTLALPLVLLGVEKLLREKRCRLLAASFAYVFFTSYYIGYMIGGFSLLYFAAVYLADHFQKKNVWGLLLRFMGCAALAAACCAVLLLPAYFNLQSGQEQMWQKLPEPSFVYSASQLFSKLTPGSYDSLTDSGSPNVFCSVAAVVLGIVFFFSSKTTKQEKFVFGGFLLVLLVSFSLNWVNLAWHAFEPPTWFPARYSFVFSFFLLHLALRCGTHLLQIPKHIWLAGGAAALVLFLEPAAQRLATAPTKSALLACGFVAAYVLIALALPRLRRPGVAAAAFLLLVAGESFWNMQQLLFRLDQQFGYHSRTGYAEFHEKYQPLVDWVQQQDSAWYRMELADQRTANGGMALGYPGISHYSTTTDQTLNQFLKQLGYNTGTINELRFSPSTPTTNSFLGIRYILSEQRLEGYTLLRQQDGIFVYQNPNAFPLAFFADAKALQANTQTKDPFMLQNQLLAALSLGSAPEPVFAPLPVMQELLFNMQRQEGDGYVEYSRLAPAEPSSAVLVFENPQQLPAYGYLPVYNNRHFLPASTFVNKEFVQFYFAYRYNSIIPLGTTPYTELQFDLNSDLVRYEGAYFYTMNPQALEALAGEAQANAVTFGHIGQRTLAGKVTAPKDGIVATTIPFDDGWRVKVDGKPVVPQKLAGVFLAIPLEAGTHTLELAFLPKGLAAGAGISAGGLLMLCWLFWNERHGRFHKRRIG